MSSSAATGGLVPGLNCVVSVVFPCLNEAAAVGECVREALVCLDHAGVVGEVIVCDNGSTDGSQALAVAAGARLVSQSRRGYGATIMKGIEAAQGRYIIMADADGTYDLTSIDKLLAHLVGGADLVLGDRYLGQLAPGSMPWLHRHVGTPVTSALVNFLFGTRIHDVNCGLRAFTRQAYDRMNLRTSGMEFASEMVARAARVGLSIAEEPVNYRPRLGESKLRTYRDGGRHFRFLLMYSPMWLYAGPAVAMSAIGLAMLLLLLLTPFSPFGMEWDPHVAAASSLLTVFGAQVGWLGISARTVAVVHGFEPADSFLSRLYGRFSLERGLILALTVVALGTVLAGAVLGDWVRRGFSPVDAVPSLILAITLIVVGVQSVFNTIFLSLLGVQTRAPWR